MTCEDAIKASPYGVAVRDFDGCVAVRNQKAECHVVWASAAGFGSQHVKLCTLDWRPMLTADDQASELKERVAELEKSLGFAETACADSQAREKKAYAKIGEQEMQLSAVAKDRDKAANARSAVLEKERDQLKADLAHAQESAKKERLWRMDAEKELGRYKSGDVGERIERGSLRRCFNWEPHDGELHLSFSTEKEGSYRHAGPLTRPIPDNGAGCDETSGDAKTLAEAKAMGHTCYEKPDANSSKLFADKTDAHDEKPDAPTPEASDAAFFAKLDEVSAEVSRWPAWKQDVLANSFRSSNEQPRPPIPEASDPAEWEKLAEEFDGLADTRPRTVADGSRAMALSAEICRKLAAQPRGGE